MTYADTSGRARRFIRLSSDGRRKPVAAIGRKRVFISKYLSAYVLCVNSAKRLLRGKRENVTGIIARVVVVYRAAACLKKHDNASASNNNVYARRRRTGVIVYFKTSFSSLSHKQKKNVSTRSHRKVVDTAKVPNE